MAKQDAQIGEEAIRVQVEFSEFPSLQIAEVVNQIFNRQIFSFLLFETQPQISRHTLLVRHRLPNQILDCCTPTCSSTRKPILATYHSTPPRAPSTDDNRNMMEFSSESSLVQVDVNEHGVALVKLNRPEKRNALSQSLIDTLIKAIAMVERDVRIKVAVLTGSRTAGPFSGKPKLAVSRSPKQMEPALAFPSPFLFNLI